MRFRIAGGLLLALALPAASQYAPPNERWNQPIEPFRIVGNVYYVGAASVSAFLFATPKGHILLDTGFAETVPLIESGMKKLGFKMEDIRILLTSHAHYDHAGGLAAVKERTGARLLMNPREVEQFARGGKGDFAFGDTVPFPPVDPDELLSDGKRIQLGDTVLTAHFTPGHTKGCTSYSAEISEGGETYDLVFACSLTAPGYQLVNNPKYQNIVEDYETSYRKLRSLPCDVFIGGHSWEFELPRKRSAMREGGPNPFIDPESFRQFLDKRRAAFDEQLKEQGYRF